MTSDDQEVTELTTAAARDREAVGRIDWAVNREDAEHIGRIVKLAHANHPGLFDHMTLTMDLTACHLNDCPLDLAAFEAAGTGDEHARFDFAHDLSGITRHINRTTGRLGNCFVPRFARKQGS